MLPVFNSTLLGGLKQSSNSHQQGRGNTGNGLQGTSGTAGRVRGGGGGSGGGGGGSGQSGGGRASGDVCDSDIEGTRGPGLGERGLAEGVVGRDELGPVLHKLGGVERCHSRHQGRGQIFDRAVHGSLGTIRADLRGDKVVGNKEGLLRGADGSRGQVDAQVGDKAERGVGDGLGQAVGDGHDWGTLGCWRGSGIDGTVCFADGFGEEDLEGVLADREDVAHGGLSIHGGIAGVDVLCGGRKQGGAGAGGLAADLVDQLGVVGATALADQGGAVDLVGEALLVSAADARGVVLDDGRAVGVLSLGDGGESEQSRDGSSDGEAHGAVLSRG
ncbi:hypothetical protein EDD21DRAFT_380559 [Dissophora ornata]|nr:hypothetical protein EDD21DRAFT_380559 [Dissophora ornata]